MNRVLSYVFGPEMYWAVMYVLARMAARRHLAPDPAITGWLDRYWIMLPLICVPLTFAFFLLPGGGRWWLLLRIDRAIAIGLAIATTEYCNGMTHHEPSAGPGAGTAWMVMLALGYTLMLAGTIIAAVVIWWRSRAPG